MEVESIGADQLLSDIRNGGRFLCFRYCVSFLVATVRRSSPVIYVAPGERAWRPALRFSLYTLLAGWWGLPWGPLYTVQCLWINLRGGIDVTAEMLERLDKEGGLKPGRDAARANSRDRRRRPSE
ncbi:MAG: hypothetical protein K1X75_11985 [Leptospirales bacterium]|nr:hypothetical protein [Leptospirales bacterium]